MKKSSIKIISLDEAVKVSDKIWAKLKELK